MRNDRDHKASMLAKLGAEGISPMDHVAALEAFSHCVMPRALIKAYCAFLIERIPEEERARWPAVGSH